MKTKQIKWQCRWWLAGLMMAFAAVARADNGCVEHITTNQFTCMSQGTLVPNYLFSPTNLSVNVGQLIIPPTISNLSMTNGLQKYYVSYACSVGSSHWETNVPAYIFTVSYLPPLPQVIWNPGTYTYTSQVVVTGSPCTPLTNILGVLTVYVGSNTPDALFDVDLSKNTVSTKVGYAAVGNNNLDFWNTYNGAGQVSGGVAGLKSVEGLVSPVGLLVTNLASIGTNGSPDVMYNDYLGTNSSTGTLTLTNLPSGSWNIYLYASDGNFSLSVSNTSLGTLSCQDAQPTNPLIWKSGVQYVVFQNVAVTNGQSVTITVNPGINGAALISGLQVASTLHQPPPTSLVPSGMVSWWRAETNGLDSIGTNNGTLMGGIGFAAGEVGQAFNFNSTNGYVSVPNSSSLNVGASNGFTLETWINPTDVTMDRPIFEWDSPTWFGVHFHIAPGQPTTGSSGPPGPGQLYANIVDSSGGWHQIGSPGGVVASNVFQHVALTYDKASGVAIIYCNGQIVSRTTMGSFTPQTSTAYNLNLGRRQAPAYAIATFAGLLDEASVYNRALNSNEIAAIYYAGPSGKAITPTQDSDYDGVSDLQELAARSNPNDPSSVPQIRLGYWRFDNTNTWAGDAGQIPLLATNVSGAPSWNLLHTNVVVLDSNNLAILKYRDVETNGNANINLRSGTIRFWFKPDWSGTNAGGLGLNGAGRLIELGNQTNNANWWGLIFNPSGTQITLGTQTNGLVMTNLSASITWTSNFWNQITLTYTTNGSILYLDGQAVTNGSGTIYYPNLSDRAAGMKLGSDSNGTNEAQGQFEELETFNYQLSPVNISSNYQSVASQDLNSDGLGDIWEINNFGTLSVSPTGDPDGDGLSNLQEYQNGTNPNVDDSTVPGSRLNYIYDAGGWLQTVSGIHNGSVSSDSEGNIQTVSQ